ncbi:M15 family metallopeptidase [Candidatus Saccharibacteria bacterium]|nr:M15 family metallopeptidase [Candidatus Saccharibacteria bacterium]
MVRRFLTSVFCFLSAVVAASGSLVGTSLALDESRLTEFAENNILYYDPDEKLSDNCFSGGELNLSATVGDLPKSIVDKLDNEKWVEKANKNKGRYQHAESETGVPWLVLAAIHYREGGMDPKKTILNGEGLYEHTNSDGHHVSADPNKDAVNAAKHLIDMGKMVYKVNIGKDHDLESLAWAALAYNRGFMYSKQPYTSKPVPYTESPYVVNFFDANHMNMRFPNSSIEPSSTRGRKDANVGFLTMLVYLNGRINGQSGEGSSGSSENGENITLIGDSIADTAKSKFLEKYPKADVHTQVSKQFYAPSPKNNPAGITILEELIDNGKLRRTLVYALGTNSSGLKKKQAEEVISLAGDNRSVVFITNYEKGKDFTNNNNVFEKMKADHSNVDVVDWASAVKGSPDKYLSDGTHPNTEGVDLWVKLLSDVLGSKSSSGCGVDIPPGEAAGITMGDRWKYLFPDGIPTSSSQMEKYLTTVKLNILNEKGKNDTMTLRVHKKLASEIKAIFDEMVAIGFKIKKSDTSSYNWRQVRGGSSRSIHSYGVAIDVNASDNPFQNPSGYKPGVNEYAVTDEVIEIWRKHGMNWGGYFGNGRFDAMHFSYLEKGSKDPNK